MGPMRGAPALHAADLLNRAHGNVADPFRKHFWCHVQCQYRGNRSRYRTAADPRCGGSLTCIPKCSVELQAFDQAFDFVERAYRAFVEVFEGHGEHAVAVNHTGFRKPLGGTDFDLKPNPANRACNRSTSHCVTNRNCGIAGENADRPPSSRLAEIRPENVVSSYHVGATSESILFV